MATDGRIQVSEIFGPVLQGEGALIGSPTIFIRTFGCDSRCEMCDSLYAVLPERSDAKHAGMTTREIIDAVNQKDPSGILPVTISGGNPAIWNLYDLINELHAEGRDAWLETQGTYWNEWIWRCDHVTVSPKGPGMKDKALGVTSMEALEDFYHMGLKRDNLCWKVVIFDREDLHYAARVAATYPGVPLYLSVGNPMPDRDVGDGVLQRNLILRLEDIQDEVFKFPELYRARVLPQLHVLMYGNRREK